MKKRYCLSLFDILLIYSPIQFAIEEYDPVTDECISGCRDFNPNNPNSFDYENGNYETIDWDKADQSKIPPHRIIEIPPNKVDVNSVQDQSRLSIDQVLYNDNYNSIADVNNLNPKVRDAILSKQANENVQTDTNNQPTQSQIYDDGFWFDSIHALKFGDIEIANGNNVNYRDGILNIENAKTIKIKDGILANVDNFSGNEIEFYVGDVKVVFDKCITIKGVKDSHFKITDKDLTISPEQDANVDILDCSLSETKFTSENNSEIKITKTSPSNYTIENGKLRFNSSKFDEEIVSNNSVAVSLDPNYGFSCMSILPIGTYFYKDENLLKSFAIHIPKDSDEYKLCVRKDEMQNLRDYDGIADLPERKINLNKIINYMRYPFDHNGILSDIIMMDVYKGLQEESNATFILDDDFIYIDEIVLSNNIPKSGEYAITYSGTHTITETFDKNYLRYWSISNKIYPTVIRHYRTKKIPNEIDFRIVENILIQENEQMKTSIIVYPNTKETKEAFIGFLNKSYHEYEIT